MLGGWEEALCVQALASALVPLHCAENLLHKVMPGMREAEAKVLRCHKYFIPPSTAPVARRALD